MKKIVTFSLLICLSIIFVYNCDGRYTFIGRDQWTNVDSQGKSDANNPDVPAATNAPDNTYPHLDPNNGAQIITTQTFPNSATLSWKSALGNNLEYKVYHSKMPVLIAANLDNLDYYSSVDVIMDWSDLADTTLNVVNLDAGSHYFNVAVRNKNQAGKITLYEMVKLN